VNASRVLIAVSADTSRDVNRGPRRDYAELAVLLRADVLDCRAVDTSFIGRAIRTTLGPAPAQAWLAFRRRSRYDVIVTDGEHIGIPLALFLRCSRSPVRHVTIGHRLSARKKRLFFRTFRVHRRMDRIALHARQQYETAVTALGIEPGRLAVIPYQVDAQFWRPQAAVEEPLVVSVGLEYRDYATLFRAVAGSDIRVVIGAASHWSQHEFDGEAPPSNVRIGSFDYVALRDLYARSSVVVVPLVDVDNQAGITTILEAMAMGKPLIVTQSLGQTDVLEDRRQTARGGLRSRPPSLTRVIAESLGIPVEATGFYVAPGDADGLRRAIDYLLVHPEERARLGASGRRVAEDLFTVEHFAERMRSLVLASLHPTYDGPLRRRALYG
jgi:glycosyltransferase involved in cell wall biosynthesis